MIVIVIGSAVGIVVVVMITVMIVRVLVGVSRVSMASVIVTSVAVVPKTRHSHQVDSQAKTADHK